MGEDAVTGDPVQDAEVVNPYRFNSKRFDGATGTYDMGFREYDPGLNRFLSRDMYSGALADMRLGADPWNSNRYAFAGGNPISRVELDGHESDYLNFVEGYLDTTTEALDEPPTADPSLPLVNREVRSGDATSNQEAFVPAPPVVPMIPRTVPGSPQQLPPRGIVPKAVGVLAILALLLSLEGDSADGSWTPDYDTNEERQRCFGGSNFIHYSDLDELDRARGGRACLSGRAGDLDPDPRGRPPGLSAGMDRSHLIAHRFGGSNTKLENIVPLYYPVNRGPMKRVENYVARQLARGRTVYYEVIPSYAPTSTGESGVPASINMLVAVQGLVPRYYYIPNGP